MVYLKAPNHDFSRLALAIIAAARDKQISVRTVQVYRQPYYYENRRENFTRNPFLDIVRDTYKDTRSTCQLIIIYIENELAETFSKSNIVFCCSLRLRRILSRSHWINVGFGRYAAVGFG